jgi:hypothetical protein
VGNQVGLEGNQEERQFDSWKYLQSVGQGDANSKFEGPVLAHLGDLPTESNGASVPNQPMKRHVGSS